MTEREQTKPDPNRDGEGIPTGVMQENTRESKTDTSEATKAFMTELLGPAREIEQTSPQSSRVGVPGFVGFFGVADMTHLVGWLVLLAMKPLACKHMPS
jgi:hypothetical protein